MIFNTPLFRYLKIYHSYLGSKIFVVLLCSIIASILEGIGVVALIPILNSMLTNENSPNHEYVITKFYEITGVNAGVQFFIIASLVFFIFKAVALFIMLYMDATFRSELAVKLRTNYIDAYSKVSNYVYRTKSSGQFVNMCGEQVNRSLVAFNSLTQLVAQLFSAIIYTMLALAVSHQSTTTLLLVSALCIPLFTSLSRLVKRASTEVVKETGNFAVKLTELSVSYNYMKVTGYLPVAIKEASKMTFKLAKLQKFMGVLSALTQSIKEPAAILLVIFSLWFQTTFMGESMSAVIIAALLLYRALNSILGVQSYWQSALENISSIVSVDGEIQKLRAGCSTWTSSKSWISPCDKGALINLNDTCFGYTSEEDLLFEEVSLSVYRGELLWISGESGVGKSTLLNIILGIETPVTGTSALLHRDSRDMSGRYGNVGYVSRDSIIYENSFSYNVSLRDSSTLSAQEYAYMGELLELLGLDEFAPHIADDVKLTQRDLGLSSGQKQRLLIARELFKQPDVLILDEVTSDLDSETEIKVFALLASLKINMAIVFVSHRTLPHYLFDKHFVIENGKLTEIEERK